MLLPIGDVLSEDQLSEVDRLLGTLAWRDGKETAGRVAKQVKINTQADLTNRTGAKLRDILREAIINHPVLRAAAWPKRLSKILVSKTGPGGGYGLHVDNAFMGTGDARLRTDLSFTLFLSDPEAYEGGDLSIEQAGVSQTLKLPKGSLILYPSTRLHEVQPVTSGERIVCIGWIESQFVRPDDRELLFGLENLRASLSASHDAQSPEMLTLAKSISNLQRRFST